MYRLTISSQLLVICLSLSVSGNNEYESKLTKLWSISSVRSDAPRTAVVNVPGGSVSVESTRYRNEDSKPSRQAKMNIYAFKPRAIPLNKRENQPSQLERSVHYTDDSKTKHKTEILFPGNYFKISEVKREDNLTEDTSFNPLDRVPFHPKIIPLLRDQLRRRSLSDEEPTIEKPNGYTEPSAMRRSISCKCQY